MLLDEWSANFSVSIGSNPSKLRDGFFVVYIVAFVVALPLETVQDTSTIFNFPPEALCASIVVGRTEGLPSFWGGMSNVRCCIELKKDTVFINVHSYIFSLAVNTCSVMNYQYLVITRGLYFLE